VAGLTANNGDELIRGYGWSERKPAAMNFAGASGPYFITAGPDGALWFTEEGPA